MKTLTRHPLGLAALLLPLAVLALWPAAPAAAEKAADLPRVEKITHKGYTEKIGDSGVTFDMVAIPGGTFLMGSPKGEKDRKDDEGPQHPVTVRPLWVGKCEVTWDEYDIWWKDNPGSKAEQRDVESGKKKVTPKDADAISRP